MALQANETVRRSKLEMECLGVQERSLKTEVFDPCTLTVQYCGCETWTLNPKEDKKVKVTEREMERCMPGIVRRDRRREKSDG